MSLVFLSVFYANAAEYIMKDIETHETSGIKFQKDQFGNFHPDISKLDSLDKKKLSSDMKKFIEDVEKNSSGNAIIAKITREEDYFLIPLLKSISFTHSFTNNVYSEWVIKNGSPMPDAYTSIGGGFIIFLRPVFDNFKNVKDYEVLMVEDKNKKGRLWLPGGAHEKGEFKYETAIRKCIEEVNLTVEKEKLFKIANWERKNATRYEANDSADFYLTFNVSGNVEKNSSEILWADWISLKTVLEKNEYEGKKLPLSFQHILKHVNDFGGSSTKPILDFRQMSKKPEDRDLKDVMLLNLYDLSSFKNNLFE